jgi:hypothetical protein
MVTHILPAFPHRKNSDNTFDSICSKCFATIARSSKEIDLKDAEVAHICQGFDLGDRLDPTDLASRDRKP